jgi:hypothetical protein
MELEFKAPEICEYSPARTFLFCKALLDSSFTELASGIIKINSKGGLVAGLDEG